ncbi:MAG: lysophospholipid acyltransferase family protein [Veillonellaceae bacterium]|nr:lysophospholipid acyltransferase family protein [Veillonellaceae bacterium]
MGYTFLRCFSKFICCLPHGLQYAIGGFLGRLMWCILPPKRKRLAIGQILFCKITDDKKEAHRIARASVVRLGYMLIDVLRYPEIRNGAYKDMVEWHGRHYLDEAKAAGKGAVLTALHSGNWELLGGVLASEGYPLISVAMQQNGGADRFINDYRELMHQHVTYKFSTRELIKELNAGSFMGLIMDQDPGDKGMLVPFFGYETLTPVGPAAMSRMKGVPIMNVTIHYDPAKKKHVIIVNPPFYAEKTKDKKRDLLVTLTALNEWLEDHIRRYPADWFWMHNRWKWTRRYYQGKIEIPPDMMDDPRLK